MGDVTSFSNRDIVALEEQVAGTVEESVVVLKEIGALAAQTGVGGSVAAQINKGTSDDEETMSKLKDMVEKLRTGVEDKNAAAVTLGNNLEDTWNA